MAQDTGTAQTAGIAAVTLVFGSADPAPDLALALQFLMDDLRAEGWRVTRLWMKGQGARLTFDGHDLTLTLCEGTGHSGWLAGFMRPSRTDGAIRPDGLRPRLAGALADGPPRCLRVTLRLAPGTQAGSGALPLAQTARLCLLPVLEAAPPMAVLWHPNALILTPDELAGGGVAVLLAPGDPSTVWQNPSVRSRARPAGSVRPAHPRLIRPRPHTRAQRAARASAGRLFGSSPALRNTTRLPRPDRALARLHAALRDAPADPVPQPGWARAARIYAVALQWLVLLPHLLAGLLTYA